GFPAALRSDLSAPALHAGIQCDGPTHLLGFRLDPHRFVADDTPLLEHGRYISAHPVEITIAAAILDDAHPRPTILEIAPHVGEHRFRHVWVANDIMRTAQQFRAGKPADTDEFVVAVMEGALGISG